MSNYLKLKMLELNLYGNINRNEIIFSMVLASKTKLSENQEIKATLKPNDIFLFFVFFVGFFARQFLNLDGCCIFLTPLRVMTDNFSLKFNHQFSKSRQLNKIY